MPLKTKFFIWIALLMTGTLLGAGLLSIWSERSLIQAEMRRDHQRRIEQFSKICEETLQLKDNLLFLNYVKSLKRERGFYAASLVDSQGQIRLHSDPKKIGLGYTDPPKENFLELSHPVAFAGSPVGQAYLLYEKGALDEFLRQSLDKAVKRISVIILLALGIGFLGALWLAKTLVRPIAAITQGMQEVSKGRRDPIPFEIRKDELGWLGQELNKTIHRLKELDEMKRDFVAGVTHDLKSPLKGIQSIQSLLLTDLDKITKTQLRESFILVQNNTTRLMKLIDDLLQTARIEAHREQLDPTLFDIRHSLKEVQELYGALSHEKGLVFKIVIPSESVYVWADREKVNHVLTNLLSNAFKFTNKGEVRVSVQEKETEVVVSVSDTGSGIPPGDQSRIFEKFQRSPHNAKDAKGTGLGLFIVKGLVDAMGGTLSLDSMEGKGSVFRFSLPKQES